MQEHFEDPFINGLIERGRTKGRQEALVSVLFAVLSARSFTVLDQVRALISTCTDPAQLEAWAARAATAKTIDEVFA
jgi:hypothetical protein